MASTNTDSMTNKQGEFVPHVPRDLPAETKRHKPGVKASPADHAPEIHAQTLPAGTAPAVATSPPPNATSEIPGQADNDLVSRSHGKEDVRTDPLSTLPGATSADVHRGLGHPGQGQTSTESRHNGPHTAKKQPSGPGSAGATGGSGLQGNEDMIVEFRRLQAKDHPRGPTAGHNVTRSGAEDRPPATAEEVAAE